MTNKSRGHDVQEIRTGVKTIFVEGSFDAKVLEILLLDISNKNIKPLGTVNFLTTASRAFKEVHPEYIYIIDRDYREDDEANESWHDFEKGKGNTIIWRRRELENYFLDPKYLGKCKYLKSEYEEIKDLSRFILEKSEERTFHGAAQILIQRQNITLRNDLEKAFNELKYDDFATEQKALQSLESIQEDLSKRLRYKSKIFSNSFLIEEYKKTLKEFRGNKSELDFDSGKWINLIAGYPIWNTIFSTYMDKRKKEKGKDFELTVIRDIVRGNKDNEPDDFKKLKELIQARIEG